VERTLSSAEDLAEGVTGKAESKCSSGNACFRGCCHQGEVERGAVPFIAVGPDAAAMRLHDGFTDRQSKGFVDSSRSCSRIGL
jgi:hypothetical protein